MDTSPKVTIDIDNGRSRFWMRAAALIRYDGYILVQRATVDSSWALPGGRVELNEQSSVTLQREIQEELNLHAIIGQLRLIIENFYRSDERLVHSIGFYYDVKLEGGLTFHESDIVHRNTDGGKEVEYRWVRAQQPVLSRLDLRPAPLGALIDNMPDGVTHAVSRTA